MYSICEERLHASAWNSSIVISFINMGCTSRLQVSFINIGMYVKGFEPVGEAWNSSLPIEFLEDKVPSYVQHFVEERLHTGAWNSSIVIACISMGCTSRASNLLVKRGTAHRPQIFSNIRCHHMSSICLRSDFMQASGTAPSSLRS